MEAQNPFEAVRAMMLDSLEKMGGATQTYLDMVETTLRGFPGANQDRISTFVAYIERQVAANRDFVERLLRAQDFQEVFRIQVEYFESRFKACVEDAIEIGSWRVQTNELRQAARKMRQNEAREYVPS